MQNIFYLLSTYKEAIDSKNIEIVYLNTSKQERIFNPKWKMNAAYMEKDLALRVCTLFLLHLGVHNALLMIC